FVVAEAIERRRIEQRHAPVQRSQQQGFGIGGGSRRTIAVTEAHASQADGKNLKTCQCARRRLCGHSALIIPIKERPGKTGHVTSSYAGLLWMCRHPTRMLLLAGVLDGLDRGELHVLQHAIDLLHLADIDVLDDVARDRKSTRLNSSHVKI